jgi:endonuclease/exonuclease/phosphatase family metal-dependent hydrolase
MIGDFNLILNAADKNNDRINRASMRRFRRCVAELELLDLQLHGRTFTWSNERELPTLVRLDRALVSLDWEELFPNSFLQALSSDASDHSPLLLQTCSGFPRKPWFHFENF